MISFTKDQAKKDRSRFGGLTATIYERDNYCCVGCGMSMDDHIKKYGKRLSINHINGVGRNSKTPDNRPEKLNNLDNKGKGRKTATIGQV